MTAMAQPIRRNEIDRMSTCRINLLTPESAPEDREAHRLAERLQCLESATGDVILDQDLETHEIWWNSNARTLLGVTDELARAHPDWWIEGIHPDDREAVIASHRAFLGGTLPSWSLEYRFRTADGTYPRFLGLGLPVRKNGERVVRFICMMSNRTENTERKMTSCFCARSTRCASAHTLDDFLRVNPAWEQAFGFTEAEMQTMNFLDIVHPDDRPTAIAELQKRTSGDPDV